ncbi:MAG: spore germination protein [Bacillota bacterium]|mgnify:FL=1|nr:spore germination protein [Bacillota bacterium]HPZ21767.1 spore germination protein [Bacillota bacterium]HQD19186.1 spore germination protein [Bacillota bacterium]
MEEKKIASDLKQNVEYLKKELGIGESFDVLVREFKVGGKGVALFFVDGFAKDDVLVWIMQSLLRVQREEIAVNVLAKLLDRHLPYIEVSEIESLDAASTSILSGALVLLIEGEKKGIEIDAREYPARSPQEPDVERVTRGSRDGFVETLIFNTALIRRRIRDPRLRIEHLTVGRRSKSDVALVYLKDVANPELVETVRGRIDKVDVDGLPMAEKSLEEFIAATGFNPFPAVRYTERPDVAAVHIFEGHVVIIVDTSPSVMIAPATFFHHLQHAEEYRQSPLVGTYIRWVRSLAVLMSLLATPLWLAIAYQPEILPQSLAFIGAKEVGHIPLYAQFFIAEIGIDIIRMATIHTPSPLATALGIIAAFLIGDVAMSVGLLVPEVILYMSAAAIGSYATPSMELAQSLKLFRLLLLGLAAAFQFPGVIGGLLFFIVLAAATRSFGVPYLWPLVPLNLQALIAVIVRKPVPVSRSRPSVVKPRDEGRM